MEKLPEFIANHLFLVTAFVAVAAMLAWNLAGDTIQGLQQVGPAEAIGLINHQDALVVDVREGSEYEQGYILNSLHIPLGSLDNQLKLLEKHRDRPLILSCRSGHRSARACRILKQRGFEKLYNMRGGILAWQNANLPVSKGKPLKHK